MLDALQLPSLPSAKGYGMRVFLPAAQRKMIIRDKRFDLIESYRNQRMFDEELTAAPSDWAMLFRGSMIQDVERANMLEGASLIYSIWNGYLERGPVDLREWCRKHSIRFEIHHTSGHADRETLQRFASAMAPKIVVPIHTEVPELYVELFDRVRQLKDGEWCEL